MILHLARDDKFVDDGFKQFEMARPNNNKLIIITESEKFVYIKTKCATGISVKELLSPSFLKTLSHYEFVVIHWLDDIKIRLINKAPDNTVFLWVGWGGDYYDLIDKKLLFPKTEKLSLKLLKNRPLKSKVKQTVLKGLKQLSKKNYNKKTALKKIDYFSPVLKKDYDLVVESQSSFTSKYISWNYGSLDQLLGENILNIKGTNILLGNSATLENNHLEAMDILSTLDLNNRKIICPLSYWYKEYGDAIAAQGKEVFGNNFMPLLEYMDADVYRDILSSCSIVIMNHVRQQALGNINIMLYYGAKVFLNRENPIYQFFMENNAVIYAIDELSEKHLDTPLTYEEVKVNRNILNTYWGVDTMREKTNNLISTLEKMN